MQNRKTNHLHLQIIVVPRFKLRRHVSPHLIGSLLSNTVNGTATSSLTSLNGERRCVLKERESQLHVGSLNWLQQTTTLCELRIIFNVAFTAVTSAFVRHECLIRID